MIIVRLWGGLGNQLFQYSYAYYLSKLNKTEICIDLKYFNQTDFRSPLLLEMNIDKYKTNIDSELDKKIRFLQKKQINRLMRIPTFPEYKVQNYTYLKESRYQKNDRYLSITHDDIYLDGYWQCESYFSQVREDLLRQFSLSEYGKDFQKLSPILMEKTTVAVHIRRGDYVSNSNPFSNLYLLEESYYRDAINQANEKLKEPTFVFFSNDINWVKETFGDLKNVLFVSGDFQLTDVEELLLMSRCKNQIIANSTFSWWAAWINQNQNKLVWAPDKWFGNRNIIPKDWIKVSI